MSLYGPLQKLEEERRNRRLRELDMRFDATLQHMHEVGKVHEDAYQAKKAILESGKHRQPPPQAKATATPKKKITSKKKGHKFIW